MLDASFFNRDAIRVARDLIGKLIYHYHGNHWLSVRIVETEAYFAREKGSHAWAGITPSRLALTMAPGTIYMYYARGGDSLNISTRGKGNAVLIKAGIPADDHSLRFMRKINPLPGGQPRPPHRLCAGQTLLCRSLGITVPDWNGKQFDIGKFYLDSDGYQPQTIIQTTRLGIPQGRDEHLPYRFIDYQYVASATKNPLTMRTPPPCRLISRPGNRRQDNIEYRTRNRR